MKSEERVAIAKTKSKLAPRRQVAGDVQLGALNFVKKMNIPGSPATDKDLETLYDRGYRLYNSGRYKDAAQFFFLIQIAHPTEPRYAMASAATYHMMKEYEGAINLYKIASILDPSDPTAEYHRADCYLKKFDLMGAWIALTMCIKRCEGKPEHEMLKERAQALLNSLDAQLKEMKSRGIVNFNEEARRQAKGG